MLRKSTRYIVPEGSAGGVAGASVCGAAAGGLSAGGVAGGTAGASVEVLSAGVLISGAPGVATGLSVVEGSLGADGLATGSVAAGAGSLGDTSAGGVTLSADGAEVSEAGVLVTKSLI